ncbi:cation transporter [Candidatus Sumerlaeota bacterium]|nr:cation transporter [Candidatus Sumerlaeota bacterium]
MNVQKRKTAVATLSVVSNSFLVVSKLVVGVAIGSVSVISEAIHSGVDLLAAGIALFAVKTSGKPSDESHPYGHGKIENLSGTIEALLIFLAAAWIVWEAVKKLIHPHALDNSAWGVGVMFVSSVVNVVVSRMLFKVGKETDSMALQADAWHLRTDVWTSAGVMGGLALIWLGEEVFEGVHFHWIDPLAAICVALLIVRAAWKLTLQSGRDLLDYTLPAGEEKWIRDYLDGLVPKIRGFHDLKTRKSGADRFVEVHLVMEPRMTVLESHAMGDEISDAIRSRLDNAQVTVHVDPYDDSEADHASIHASNAS